MSAAARDATMPTASDLARLIKDTTSSGNRIVERLFYLDEYDAFALKCGPLILMIDRDSIPEFRSLPARKMKNVRLSPAGTSLELEKHDIYIEAAGLIKEYIDEMRANGNAGFIINLLLSDKTP